MHNDTTSLVDRYVALWMEPDPEVRRGMIRGLWARDSAHVLLDPPDDMRERAAAIGFRAPVLALRGHDELETRVSRSYEEFVEPGEFEFRTRDEPSRVGNVVTFRWEMAPVSGGAAVGGGLDILVLDDEGRIRADFQLIGS
jgi:hypothetical protein